MTSTNNTTRRYALAAAILAAAVVPNALAFTTPGVSFHSTTSTGQQQRPTRHIMFSAVAAKPNKSSPVVVSEEAEALSHSDTTLKLQPSYDLFQMLTEEEGGVAPAVTTGNRNRDPSILKSEKGQMIDTLEGIEFSEKGQMIDTLEGIEFSEKGQMI
eukprot:567874_1